MINFHKLIRQQRGKVNKFIDELHVGDSVFKTDTEILIGWKSHFASLAKQSDRMDFDHSYLDTVEIEYKHIIKLCQHETVSKEELDKAVDKFNKGNNKITELRTILQRESQNS